MLCIMIKSVAGKYRDNVALIPLASIDSKILKAANMQVLEAMKTIGFRVVPLLADGHSVNTKCYKDEFCNKKLQHSVANPVSPDQKLFLLFDPVHIFKNFFNNLMNKGSFKCPPFQGKECSPRFEHVKELYKKELGKPVKIAHKITERVLAPKPIEKSNVMLAERFYHESTIAGKPCL